MKHSQTRIATLLTLALVFSFAPNALLRAEEVPPVDPPVVQEEIPQENAGADGEALPPADSIVLSGDAESIGETTVDANTIDIDTPPSVDTDVSIDNVIETVGTTTSSAETGANTAQNVDGNAGAFAGDAYAHATQIQVIDTNIINSEGLLFFADIFSGLGFDMRSLNLSFFTLENPSPTSCSFMGCPDGDLTVTANNTSDVIGDVSASAIAGGNTATSVGGNAAAVGGNAYASANGVQIVDSNIIESSYLLIGINQFGDLLDDITLPNESFFRSLLTRAPAISGPLSVSATTTIETSLTTDADADSGGNTAISDGAGAEAISGDAESAATAYSQVGSTLVGGDEIFFLFRIWGNWSGEIHGLPEGMTWEETPFGIEIRNAGGAPATNTDLNEEGCCGDQGELTVNTTNDSHAELSVRAYALTGDNRAETVEGTALAASGDAFAAANSVQIVSTNLIGRNWILAIFNIFGDWDGNVAFGHPDLWVGAIAEAGNPALPDS
ncbi:MAG: hypothetical protein WBK28_03635, partial [Minisyncoccia bacterium]